MAFPDDLLVPDEVVAHRFRPHLAIVLRSAMKAVIIIVVVGYLLDAMVQMTELWYFALMFVWFLCILSVAQTALLWLSTRYCLTDQRIIWRTGMIWRNTVEIPLFKLDHINVKEGLIGRIFHYGDMTLNSASFKGKIVWQSVPQVKEVRRQLTQLRQEDQRRRTIG